MLAFADTDMHSYVLPTTLLRRRLKSSNDQPILVMGKWTKRSIGLVPATHWGPATVPEESKQIARRRTPSGPNTRVRRDRCVRG